ncbi:MAG: peptidoglycan DD-metalloendopeptidase family protein [Bacteroidota bacterium]|nr:peptidoglycan DD-metalloendopeptidase family protein [Bacteroidota bacterium]
MLEKILKDNTHLFADVISLKNRKLFKLILSAENKTLTTDVIKNSDTLGNYINKLLVDAGADIAYGGYLENRSIYKKSEHFGGENDDARTVHLGVDLWADAGEPVYSPGEAKIHSFKNNANFGDYGATIILEHEIDAVKFYTLYGHLSMQSLENKNTGQQIGAGEQFATLGKVSENGSWPPHLHFQIISDMQNYSGDFPGVCAVKEIPIFKNMCPDPLLILNI